MAKKLLANGTATVTLYEDSFENDNKEEITFRYGEVKSGDTVIKFKFKSLSDYELMAIRLSSQIKFNKTTE